jgi:hypothetical protein
MGIKLSSGSLFITEIDGDLIKLGDSVDVSMEYAEEAVPILCELNNSASFSYEVSNMDLSFLENAYTIPTSDKFTVQYNVNIMRQRRWHKKTRINKKWLKRYGMKPDTVKMLADATVLNDNASDWSFELDCSNPRYILRSDQQRKGLKIVW